MVMFSSKVFARLGVAQILLQYTPQRREFVVFHVCALSSIGEQLSRLYWIPV